MHLFIGYIFRIYREKFLHVYTLPFLCIGAVRLQNIANWFKSKEVQKANFCPED